MERKQPSAEAVLAPPKQFLTEDQLLELWDTRGLKYEVDRIHQNLLDRGLAVYVDQPMFRKTMWDLLDGFLVQGRARRDPRRQPRQKFPKVF
jgi:hypothetical protein